MLAAETPRLHPMGNQLSLGFNPGLLCMLCSNHVILAVLLAGLGAEFFLGEARYIFTGVRSWTWEFWFPTT